jgi:endonuclease III
MESLQKKRARTKKIISILKKTHPDAKLALNFSTPLELLIALILAAQARDDLVNQITAGLFKKYRTAAHWAKEKPEKLQEQLRRINFYRNKTRSIQNACRVLVEKFGGQVPDNLDDLLTLPGVGRKTANILLGNSFGKPAIGVDTHVARLAQRLGLSQNDAPDDIEADLVQIVSPKDRVTFCHLLQFHGRRVCQAKRPDCPHCSINKLCPYPHKTTAL